MLIVYLFPYAILAQEDTKPKENTSILSFTKATKKVIDKSNMPKYREEFFVLILDDTVKHGKYKKISGRMANMGTIIEEGSYAEGKKTGLWKLGYEKWGYAQGQYLNDKKVGIWEYYDYNKKLEHKYDHTNHELLFRSEWKNKCDCIIIDGAEETLIKPDILPTFVGGETEMYRPLFDLITPTHEVFMQKKSGTVLIEVIIDEQGKIEVKGIHQGLEPKFDKEVLEGIKIPNEFLPAQKNEKNVKVRCYFPYTFKSN